MKTKSLQSWRKKNSFSSYGRRASFGSHNFMRRNGPKKTPRLKKLFQLFLFLLVFLIGFGGLGSLIVLGWVAKDLPNPNKIIERDIAQSTKIYDRTGQTLLYDVHGQEQRTVVKLEDIPQYVKDATITAEDRKFYEHSGISITGIIRSFIRNITTGSKVGGSTLTQQLVKNAVLSPEIILSYQIERKFSKDEILQMYFNEIPYGSVAYGVEAAAQTYFGKSVKDINLAEAAVLAAIPQKPTYYSPYGNNTDALFARQHYILDSMAELGYISKDQAEAAKTKKIEFKKKTDNLLAPHFVMYVKEYLTEKYGDLAVEQGGLKVITTLDLYKQNIAEKIVSEVAEKNAKTWNANNAAMIAIDTKTGQILSMVGSKDYFAQPTPNGCTPGKDCLFDPQVNATLSLRQPGSSFKPIVYSAAFKKGYTPDTVLYDVVTKFINYDGKDYEPKNYTLKENGPVTIRKALAGSLNIPAVKAIYLTGVDNVIDLAEALGYTSLKDRSRFGLALVLGGAEVRLIEHTNAFAALAREGEWHETSPIMEVRDKDGNLLEEFQKNEKKVLETQVARQITNILSDNSARAYIFGENNLLNLGERPVAAKTGTTNDYRDAWTIGYTPSLAVGVWVGNNNNQAMKLGADGSVIAAPIWHRFMAEVLGNTPAELFQEPDPVVTGKQVLDGTAIGGLKVRIDRISGKLATNLTPENLVEEKIFAQNHCILHYISKDDPRGDTPPDLSDPQYLRWEEAVQRWAQQNNYTSQEPPTQYDDVHTLANKPTIQIVAPSANQTISDRNLAVQVQASAARGINKVEYYLDDKLIRTVNQAPFNLYSYLSETEVSGGGFYTLKAIAYDDAENSSSATVEVNFQF